MKKREDLKVLIVDDSAVFRKILESLMNKIKGAEVVGKASNGKLALKQLEMKEVDLVLLDVVMPEMDGIEALIQIKKLYPKTSIVMVSSASSRDADITVKALEYGALDFIAKNVEENIEETPKHIHGELQRVVKLIHELSNKDTPIEAEQSINPEQTTQTEGVDLVVIGTSTGGPQALLEIVPLLGDLEVPVVVLQHMPANFTRSLAEHMNECCRLEVKEATHQEQLKPECVYVAPGGRHLKMSSPKTPWNEPIVEIVDQVQSGTFSPSIDIFLKSIHKKYAKKVLTIILTGMGKDCLKGVEYLKQHGSYSISQNKQSSIVFGMPQQIIKHGLADEVLPLYAIANRINKLTEREQCTV